MSTPTTRVTIDNYAIQAHERYANDQSKLELKYIKDSSLIPPHFEVPVSEATFSSEIEELFETHLSNSPWALFSAPPEYLHVRNRFFSYNLSANFDWSEDEKQEEEKEEEESKVEDYKKRIYTKHSKYLPIALFEKDRSALLNLLESVTTLNQMLREVHGKKLQYQRG